MNYIGFDVDSKYLVCRIQRGEKRLAPAQFENNPSGHESSSNGLPNAIMHFAVAQMQRGKTYALDALEILEYNLRMEHSALAASA